MTNNRKVAIVTGASQGIGASIVQGYRDIGYAVVANSRNIKLTSDPHIVAIKGDIGERETAERVVGAAIQHFGRIDTLVNNAGVFIGKPFTEFTTEDYRNALHVNLDGFYHITQLALLEMIKQGGGHVVQITTALVDQPIAGVGAGLAALTKGGLDAVTRALAIEFAEKGIRVNAVAPGIVNTPMHPPQTHSFLAGLHPIERLAEPHEIMEAVLYLEQAQFVTGETLHVDGGQHAGRG